MKEIFKTRHRRRLFVLALMIIIGVISGILIPAFSEQMMRQYLIMLLLSFFLSNWIMRGEP